jgi:hypothetical protein
MPNSTSVTWSPTISAIDAGRNDRRSMMPRLDSIYSIRSRTGLTCRGEWPATLHSRAAYSSANAVAAPISMAVNSQPSRASISGTDARIIASTSITMMATISRTSREPTELGK